MEGHLTAADYIAAKRAQAFSWSANNCMSFAVEWIDHPELPLRWFLGHSDARACLSAYRRRAREVGHPSLAAMLDTLLLRKDTLYPRNGYVVARPADSPFGAIYGLHWMYANWFLTEQDGLQGFDPHHADVYWSKA